MAFRIVKTGIALMALAVLSACSSVVAIKVEPQFPTVVFNARDVSAAIVFSPEFQTFVAKPNANTTMDIGSAQVDLLGKAFSGLFKQIEVVSSREEVSFEKGMVIIPTVREVQLSTPSETYLNVYEVWIKYNLEIESVDGEPIDSWFMPVYGKTPDSFMLSRAEAIEEATVVALRDAGAKLLLDFFRIPSVYSWIEQQQDL